MQLWLGKSHGESVEPEGRRLSVGFGFWFQELSAGQARTGTHELT